MGKELVRVGRKVIIVCRSEERGKKAREEMMKINGEEEKKNRGRCELVLGDLSNLSSGVSNFILLFHV